MGTFSLGTGRARSSLGTGTRPGSERGGWGHAAAAPAGPHCRLGHPSVLKSVYFKGDKVLGCCRVTRALAEPLIKVSRGCRQEEEEEEVGGWQQPGTVPPPYTRTPLDLAPMCWELAARCRGCPAARPHCPAARAGVGTAICSSLPAASLFAARRTLAQEAAPHVLRPFPLAEAPNEIKDLLQRGGGTGKWAEQFENVAPGRGAGLSGWVQAGPGAGSTGHGQGWALCRSRAVLRSSTRPVWLSSARAGGWCQDLRAEPGPSRRGAVHRQHHG